MMTFISTSCLLLLQALTAVDGFSLLQSRYIHQSFKQQQINRDDYILRMAGKVNGDEQASSDKNGKASRYFDDSEV